jgi:hypothetical protein
MLDHERLRGLHLQGHLASRLPDVRLGNAVVQNLKTGAFGPMTLLADLRQV